MSQWSSQKARLEVPISTLLQRLSHTPWRDRLLLAEALFVLAGASAAISLLPFRLVVRFAALPMREPRLNEQRLTSVIHGVCWATQAVAHRVPWRAVCFQRGLTVHIMLRRRGVPTTLHYGVRRSDGAGLQAHVWVTHEDTFVMGGKEAPEFACLASFPASQKSDRA